MLTTVGATALAQANKVGAEFLVNSFATGDQRYPAVAVRQDGGFVVVWESPIDGASLLAGTGIAGRRFSATGVGIATEFRINSYTPNIQTVPVVAFGAGGEFLVVWQSDGEDGQFGGIVGRRFDASGVAQSVEFVINSFTTSNETVPALAMNADGDFVVAWRSIHDGSGYGVFARRFTAPATAVGLEFQVNTYTQDHQGRPAVAIDGDGDFVVVWPSRYQDGSLYGVFARRFDAAGVPLSPEIQVNVYTPAEQRNPAVAMNGDGDFIVSWRGSLSDGSQARIFVRRFGADGLAHGGDIQVSESTADRKDRPMVAIVAGGDFLVSWESTGQDGSNAGVFARRFAADGTPIASELQINMHTTGNQYQPRAAMENDGDFIVAWDSEGQVDSTEDVFAQRWSVIKTFDFDVNGATDPLTDGLLLLRYLFGFRGGTLTGGAVAPNCSRCTAAPLEAYLGGLVAGTVVKSIGTEFQVNSYTALNQDRPAAAASAGGFVLAWHSPHDGSQRGVFARPFDSVGAPKSGELQVNDYATGEQANPVVAMGSDGHFVVVWQSYEQDGSDYGVFARRFNTAGAPQAGEFRVNSYTGGPQSSPVIAMRGSGEFVLAWQSGSQDGSDRGVFARRFDAAGVPQAAEFQVNTRTTGYQIQPQIGIAANGSFVIAWQSFLQDGSGTGVFARRFDATGAAQALEFQVNSYTTGYQYESSIAVAAGGGFIVTWESDGQDHSAAGVFARRFDAAGVKQGVEFQVNVRTASDQYDPVAGATGDGGFLVAWQSYLQDGQNGGVFARAFDAAGVARGSEFQVNSYVSSFQSASTVAGAAGGTFVVGWRSSGQDASGYGVFARRMVVSSAFDIDGDGTLSPLTDGLLVLRYLFGFRSATLINGAVAPGCTRCSAASIESYIATKV